MKWVIILCLLIAYLTRSEASDTADKIIRKIRCIRMSDPNRRELPKPKPCSAEMTCQECEELRVTSDSNGCRYHCEKLIKPKEYRRIARLFKASDKKNAKTHMKQLDLARSQDAIYKIMRQNGMKKGEWRSLNSGKRCIPTKDNKGRCVFIHHFDGALNKSENKNRKNDANAL